MAVRVWFGKAEFRKKVWFAFKKRFGLAERSLERTKVWFGRQKLEREKVWFGRQNFINSKGLVWQAEVREREKVWFGRQKFRKRKGLVWQAEG